MQPVCVFFGAAHMYDLQNRLMTQQGYTLAETRWTPDFEVDLSSSKISTADAAAIKADAVAGRFGCY